MKLGVIGLGQMGTAIIKGVITKNVIEVSDIYGYDVVDMARARGEELGINICENITSMVGKVDIILFAVKPQQIEEMLQSVPSWGNAIIISIVAGKSLAWLEDRMGGKVKIVRCMPNTPALICEGVTGVCANQYVSDDDLMQAMLVIESYGMAIYVKESQMDAVVGVSGSAPAYVYMLIEAMADAAVASGLTRADAYKFAAKTVAGSANMVLKTGKHPGELKDMVCSPSGTTIEAVKVLEEKGFRGAVMDAVIAAAKRSSEL